MPSYEDCLEAAGAEVLCSEEFGDYQGTSWARVIYEGIEGWVSWGFGSCSGCDDLEGEFEYSGDDGTPEYRARMALFGRGYLDNIMSQEQALKEASEHISWDSEADKVVEFILTKGGKAIEPFMEGVCMSYYKLPMEKLLEMQEKALGLFDGKVLYRISREIYRRQITKLEE